MFNRRIFKVLALLTASFIVYISIVSFYSDNKILYSAQPPQGFTGENDDYCTSCHQGNSLNSPGGSVVATGLPVKYVAGQKYNFSIGITHSTATRKKWGFSVKAINSAGATVGTFSTTNPNAKTNGPELSHYPAVATNLQSSYTYLSLAWTAPASPGINDQTIRFYFVGNAADGSLTNNGDYIYSGMITATRSIIYTFTGSGNWNEPSNWSNNTLPPATLSGNAEIIVNPFEGDECILNVPQTLNNGAKLTVVPGAIFRIAGNLTLQ